ncbi:MAG: hypothetical protein M1819_000397 [Sarea resinae]|nr:MAG: hypothetical protein M1819_000397 [Sarea resinae]
MSSHPKTPVELEGRTPSSNSGAGGETSSQENKPAVHHEEEKQREESKRPPVLRRIWTALDLDTPTLVTMIKGSLPPTIALALLQITPIADHFLTQGYVFPVASVLGLCILPRAKFFQTIILDILAICLSAAMALLAIFCSVQAREHTTPKVSTVAAHNPSSNSKAPYNSSASAICAIWLFFNIYVINALRSRYVPLQFPSIVYAVFINISMAFAPTFASMAQGKSFVARLLEIFLAGFALATAISLLVIPVTMRTVIFKESVAQIGAFRRTLAAQGRYLQSIEEKDMFSHHIPDEDGQGSNEKKAREKGEKKKDFQKSNPEAEALKGAMRAVASLHGKMHGDMPFAKREIAYGKLGADDIEQLFRLFRGILLPMTGMSSVVDIYETVADKRGWNQMAQDDIYDEGQEKERRFNDMQKALAIEEWHNIMKYLHGPFESILDTMDEAFEHVLLVLELKKRPRRSDSRTEALEGVPKAPADLEGRGDGTRPGDEDFAEFLEKRIQDFHVSREGPLKEWSERRGVDMPDNFFSEPFRHFGNPCVQSDDQREHIRGQHQLYLILYMEFLMWSTAKAVQELVRFADLKVEDGTMKRSRMIFCGLRRLKKWAFSLFTFQDSGLDESNYEGLSSGAQIVYLGDSFKSRKDPEHLPPATTWERLTDKIRVLPKIIGSVESAFGFRVACATLSVGIIGFLHQTQHFFIQQRIYWAMIMISIAMTITAGSSAFGFFARIMATFLAMVISFVVYYIPDKKAGGVITLFWFVTFLEFYFFVKFPRFIIAAIMTIITQIVILGYELQVGQLGKKVSTSTGQPFYPTYKLAPYRLAVVSAGMAVAFFWTIFPYPINDSSQLRKDLGSSLYLLANYYSCVHETVRMRLRGKEGDPELKNSPGCKLNKARNQVFSKEMMLLSGLRQHSDFSVYELKVGGKFPKQRYDTIIDGVQKILNYMALMAYSSAAFSRTHSSPDTAETEWIDDFSRVVDSVQVTTHAVTSTLCLLSNSVLNGQPLPPYLQPPRAYELSQRLEAIDREILSVKHVAEPGYAAFAVMQVASGLVVWEVEKLARHVKALVGVVDFSFHIVSTSTSLVESGSGSGSGSVGKEGKED